MTQLRYDSLANSLAVTGDVLERRARELFERESGRPYPTQLVLCGAGRLGGIAADGLRRAGVVPLAIADNNPLLSGTKLGGCDVLSVESAVERFGRDAVFVTTVYTARPFREQLKRLGVRVASFRSVAFQHPEVFLPHGSMQWPATIVSDADQILAGLGVWSDDESRDEYVAQIAWQLILTTEMPPWRPAEQTYFPDGLIRLGENESFVDCGAFDGDTVRAIIARTGTRFDSVLALEPDPGNYAALTRFVGSLPGDLRSKIATRQVAVHSHRATLRFESGEGAGSNLTEGGDLEVQAAPLDELLAERNPTFIKWILRGQNLSP